MDSPNLSPKVSVIIPAYNEEKFILETIRSVQSQAYSNIEILVVDNNSTDGTPALLEKVPGIRVFREERKGVQFAREYGRLNSTGDIIANLDADCLPAPDWISKGVKYFDDPKVIAVSGPYFYHDGKFVFRYVSLFLQKVIYPFFHFLGSYVFKRGVIIFGGNVLIKATALQKIGGYNTSIAFYGDDTDTGNRLFALGKVLFKNDMIISSSSRRFDKNGFFSTSWKYVINYVWEVVFQRPFNNQLTD